MYVMITAREREGEGNLAAVGSLHKCPRHPGMDPNEAKSLELQCQGPTYMYHCPLHYQRF